MSGSPIAARIAARLALVVVLANSALAAAPLTLANGRDASLATVQVRTDELLGALAAWQDAAVTGASRSSAEIRLVRAATARMQALQQLIEVSPADAARVALPTNLLAKMPWSAQPYLETRRTVSGTLEVRWADYADHAVRADILTGDEGRWSLRYTRSPGSADLQSGRHAAATGIAVGELLALDPQAVTTVTTTATATATTLPLPYVYGQQHMLVIPVTFAANPVTPYTTEYVRSQFFVEADAYYRDVSSGRTWLAGDVAPWLTLDLDPGVCDIDKVAALADVAAKARGFDPATYDRIAYVMPGMTCGWAGLAITGPVVPTRVWLTSVSTRIVAHELGHNLGLHHSRGRVCATTDPWSSTCTGYEYGDLFDLMGNAAGSPFNALQMRRLGYLDTDSGPQSLQVTASGRYTIGAYAGTGTLPRALRVAAGVDPTTGAARTLYVTLRQPVGRDSALPYTTGYDSLRTTRGVAINAGIENNGDVSLLDATPLSHSGTADFSDAPFLPGESLADPASGVTIAPVEVVEGSAIVSVSVASPAPPPPATNLPPVGVDDAASVAAGGSVSIPVLANDYDPEKATISVASETQPAHGQVSLGSNGTLVYRPARKFTGSDSFTYAVSDGVLSDVATVTVTVTATVKSGRTR